MRGQRFAGAQAADTVAMVVDARRIGAEAELRGKGCDDAAAYAALGGNADPIDPATCRIVHARAGHHGERAGHGVGGGDLLAGQWIAALVGEGRRHDRQVPRGNAKRALAEIDVEHLVDVTVQHAVVAQQIGDRPVAVAAFAFRPERGFVHLQPVPSGKARERGSHALEGAVGIAFADQPDAGDRACIDHRVEGPIVRAQADGIERIAARLHANDGFDPFRAELIEGEREYERLRNRLDGELHGAVADFVDEPVDCRGGNAEMIRIGKCQFGNVGSDLAAIILREISVAVRARNRARGSSVEGIGDWSILFIGRELPASAAVRLYLASMISRTRVANVSMTNGLVMTAIRASSEPATSAVFSA
jgi:hypothetical protein